MKGNAVRRAAGAAVVVAAVLGAAAACTRSGGADTPDERPLAALRGAESATRQAGSARVESDTVMGGLMSMTAKGAVSWTDGLTGTLTLTYTGGTLAETMRKTGSTTMEARYLPDAYYARMGTPFAAQTGGRHWIRYGYDDLERLAGGQGAYLEDQLRDTSPNRSVKLLLASGDVRKVGAETVRGRRTTHYSGSVDADSSSVTTETLDIWVDERGLLAKKVEKGVAGEGQYSQTAYYAQYGVEVTARRPPAGDTADFTELVRELGGASASPSPSS